MIDRALVDDITTCAVLHRVWAGPLTAVTARTVAAAAAAHAVFGRDVLVVTDSARTAGRLAKLVRARRPYVVQAWRDTHDGPVRRKSRVIIEHDEAAIRGITADAVIVWPGHRVNDATRHAAGLVRDRGGSPARHALLERYTPPRASEEEPCAA